MKETGGTMSERTHEQKVKDVRVDEEYLCIELLNGLRLTGPMRTKPIYRDPLPVDTRPPAADGFLPAMSV
jgi:hypothetical protein